MVDDLIAKSARKVKGLAQTIAQLQAEDPAEETQQAVEALRAEIKAASSEAVRLKKERAALDARLAKLPRPEPYMQLIRDISRLLRELRDPDFEVKRKWLDRLDVEVMFRVEPDTGRWLDVSCSIGEKSIPLDAAGEASIELHPSG